MMQTCIFKNPRLATLHRSGMPSIRVVCYGILFEGELKLLVENEDGKFGPLPFNEFNSMQFERYYPNESK